MEFRKRILKALTETVLGTILTTILLTPYMILVIGLNLEQYISWLFMQAIIVPPMMLILIKIVNHVTGKLFSERRESD